MTTDRLLVGVVAAVTALAFGVAERSAQQSPAATDVQAAGPRVAITSLPTAGSRPRVITVGPDGAIWFANYYGSSLGRIGTLGVIRVFRHPTVDWPAGITGGPDGALWFTNCDSIGRVTTTGTVSVFRHESINRSVGITAGPDGALWFTNGDSIGRITITGRVSFYRHPSMERPAGITVVPCSPVPR